MLPLLFASVVVGATAQPSAAPSSNSSQCPTDTDASVLVLFEPGPIHLDSAIRDARSKIGEVFVTIGANGNITSASIYRSTDSMQLDRELLRAAVATTYSPAIANCKPVESKYDYRLTFAPYAGDNVKDDARFQAFMENLLAAGQAPVDSGVRLDPKITPAQALHDTALRLSSLGSFRGLHFFDDNVIGGVHRLFFAARFDKGKADVVFWVDATGTIVGFTSGK